MGSHKLETEELHPLDKGSLILVTWGARSWRHGEPYMYWRQKEPHLLDMESLIREAWRAIFWRQKEHHSLDTGSLILETNGVSYLRHLCLILQSKFAEISEKFRVQFAYISSA
jgi:hypothetical protein